MHNSHLAYHSLLLQPHSRKKQHILKYIALQIRKSIVNIIKQKIESIVHSFGTFQV